MKRICGIAVTMLVLAPSAVLAAPHGRPGLWNIFTTMQMAMPQLPPEAMAMMKSRGMKLPGMGGEPVKTQICMTQDDIDADALSRMQAQNQMSCKPRILKQSANSVETEIVCRGAMEGTGRAQVSWRGDNHYEGSYNFKGSMRGQPHQISTHYTGDWVKADCGAVKPFKFSAKPH